MLSHGILSLLGFHDGSVAKNPPANTGDAGSILGQEDPLEKEMATHSSIFAWKIPWTGEPGGLQSMGSQRVGHHLGTKQQPWNSPGQNTGVGSLFLLQGIFTTQGSNPGLPHCRQILYHLSHWGSTDNSV